MKEITKTIIKYVAFLLILAILLVGIAGILERKDSINHYKPFFDSETDFDVLLLGSSHVACGISPMVLWRDYGITSYNFGNSGEMLPVTYWTALMAMEYCNPKMVVIDMFTVFDDVEILENENNSTHDGWDCFPLSLTKVKAVLDLVPGLMYKSEYLFNLGKFHSRWNELKQEDFTLNTSRSKGLWAYGKDINLHQLEVNQFEDYETIDDVRPLSEAVSGAVYARRLIEECQNRGIEVLLVALPVYMEGYQEGFNAVNALAEEYGVNYINFVNLNSVTDCQTDMIDKDHLNPSGMAKISDYLGNYITNNYDIPDRRNDEGYKSWWEDNDDFINLKIETLDVINDFPSMLEYLHDKDFSFTVEFAPGCSILTGENIAALLNNTVRQHILPDSGKALRSHGMKTLGGIEYAAEKGWGYKLVVKNSTEGQVAFSEELIPPEQAKKDSGDAIVTVIDNRNGETVYVGKWNGTMLLNTQE